MLRTVLDARLLIALAIATGVGACGLLAYPVRGDEVFLAVIEARTFDPPYPSSVPRQAGMLRLSLGARDGWTRVRFGPESAFF
jgi:hypothetical protein